MCKICPCDAAPINSGAPNCLPLPGNPEQLYFVSKYDTNGNLNAVPKGTTIDQAFLDAKLQALDPLARWYPMPRKLKQVAPTTEPGATFSYDDNTTEITGLPITTFTGWLPNTNPRYLKVLNQFNCGEWGIYGVDCNKNLIGNSADFAQLYPTYIEQGTFSAINVPKAGDTPQYLSITFNISSDSPESCTAMIVASEITANLSAAKGLIDICPVKADYTSGYEVVSATQVRLRATTIYGTTIDGLVVADFTLTNSTTGLPVVITALTAEGEGSYLADFAAQSTGDKMVFSRGASPTNLGFGYDKIATVSFLAA